MESEQCTPEVRKNDTPLCEAEEAGERNQSREILSELLIFYQTLIDTVPLPVFYKDTNGIFIGCNKAYEDYFHISRNDLKGKSVYDILPKEQADIQDAVDRDLFLNPGLQTYESTILRADGNLRNVVVNKATFSKSDGTLSGLIGIVNDVTEQKQFAAGLSESEERYKTVVNHSNDGIMVVKWVPRAPGHILFANKRIIDILGYDSSEEVVGKPLTMIVHPDEWQRLAAIDRARRHGEPAPSRYELRHLRKDGTPVDLEISSASTVFKGETVSMAILRDITDRKQSEMLLHESETKFRALFDHANDAIFLLKGGIFIDCNKKTLEMFHVRREDIIGQSPARFSPAMQPEGQTSETKARHKIGAALHGVPQFFEWRHSRPDGTAFDTEVALNRIDINGAHVLQAIVRDITERKEQEDRLLVEKRKFQILAEQAPFAMVMIDRKNRFTYLNPKFTEVFGYDLSDVPDGRAWLMKAYPQPEYRHQAIAAWKKDTDQSKPGEKAIRVFTVTCKDGTRKTVSIKPVELEDCEYIITYEDITERIKYEKNLAHMASHDTLTGLPNRRYLEESLLRSAARARRGQRGALFIMDLDNFKSVNDTLGHIAGDSVLVAISDQLKDQLRIEDVLIRLGGDEFAVLLENTDSHAAYTTAERMRSSVETHPFHIHGRTFPITLSIGVAEIDGKFDATQLLSMADAAMYKAKERGKNRVSSFTGKD